VDLFLLGLFSAALTYLVLFASLDCPVGYECILPYLNLDLSSGMQST